MSAQVRRRGIRGAASFAVTRQNAVAAITTVLPQYTYPHCIAEGCLLNPTRTRAPASRPAVERKLIAAVHLRCSNAWKACPEMVIKFIAAISEMGTTATRRNRIVGGRIKCEE